MLPRVLHADRIRDLHDLVGHQVADTPALVDSELLQVRSQVLVYFVARQRPSKVNAAIDSLHSHTVLLILVEVPKDLEQILLWHVRYKFYHIIEYERGALSHLRNLILRRLHE